MFSLTLPKYELYETGSQLRRSSKAISVNIVEGFGRRKYIADYLRFLIYAQSSCDETIEWMSYIIDCHEEDKESAVSIHDELIKLGKMINRFISAVSERSIATQPINKAVSN
jgi:four helix bundle protein